MAFALKYTSTFYQVKDYSTTGEWQIKIYLDGYGGGSTEIKTVGDTISLNRGGDFKSTMLTTTLNFSVYNETEGQFIEFADADWGAYYVELIKDPNGSPETIFYGYNQTDIYTEPYEQTPYPSQLKFTCGLSHLKYVRWDNSGTLYDGQKSLIEILRIATNKLPIKLDYREFVNVYEDSQLATTTDSTLNQTFVDAALFKKMTKEEGGAIEQSAFMCYQVIEEILKVFYCHIYQWGGKWYIVRKQEYKDSTMYFRDFLARDGAESTITIDGTGNLTTNKKTVTNNNGAATDIIFPVDAEKEVMPPLNRVQVKFTQQNLDFQSNNLIRNGDFMDIDLAAGVTTHNGFPTWWTYSGGINPLSYFSITTVPTLLPDSKLFRFDTASFTATAYDSTKYIQYAKTDVTTGTADTIEISMNIYILLSFIDNSNGTLVQDWNDFVSEDVNFVVPIQLKFGTYYLGGDATNGYSWSTTAGKADFEINGFGNSAAATNWWHDVINITQELPTMPETGLRDMEFRVYQPFSDLVTWSNQNPTLVPLYDGIGLTDFKLTYLPAGLEPATEQVLYADINEDEIYEEINVIMGDTDNTVAQGAFRLSTVALTDLWNRRSKTENLPILKILIESLGDDRGDYNDILKGKLIGEFDGFNTVQMTVGAITSHYHIENFNLMLETYEWGVSLYRLQTFTPSIAIVDSITTVPKSTPTTLDPPVNNNPAERIVGEPSLVVGGKVPTKMNTTNTSNYN